MQSIKTLLLSTILGTSLVLAGCSDSGDGPTTPGGGSGLRAQWGGANGIGTLFTQRCTPCHISQTPRAGGLDLSSYTALRTRDDDLSPGDAANSYLLQKLGEAMGGSRMPQGGPYFTNAQIDTIRVWIQAGALNN